MAKPSRSAAVAGSSTSPEPAPTQEALDKAERKRLRREAKAALVEEEAEPEEDTPRVESKKYTPPTGLRALKVKGPASSLDWDLVNDDEELQLWAIRVPAGVKHADLDGMTIQLPLDGSASLEPLATFRSGEVEHGIYLADGPVGGGKRKRGDVEPTQSTSGGQEMKALMPLLPKRSAGDKLFLAPRPITHSLLITQVLPANVLDHLPSASSSLIDSQPSPVPGAVLSVAELLEQNGSAKKPRREQPAGLKFRLAVAGAQGFNNGKRDVEMGSDEVKPEAESEAEEEAEE